jgi:hypothetical protein
METSVSLKTMNNPTRRFRYIFAAVVAFAGFALSASQIQARAEEQASTQTQSGADRVSVTLSDPARPALVKANLIDGGITVKAYEGKEVIVEARVRNHESARQESGPKRIAIATTGLTVEEENNQVNINTESFARAIDLSISVPVHTSLHLRALNGRLLVTFTRINQKPMAFSSLNGDIDVTFPADLKANVSLRSDRGDVFSDFDVQMQASSAQPIVEDGRGHGGKYRVKIDKTVRGSINGGGPELQFTNFNGQIYIRKAGAPR